MQIKQPLVIDDGWGQIEIAFGGKTYQFKDAVILPDKAFSWDWNWNPKDPMKHSPGIREIDIDHFLLSEGFIPDAVILSQGRFLILKVHPHLTQYLQEKGVKQVYVLRTDKAITKYIELASGSEKVAALIHTTC